MARSGVLKSEVQQARDRLVAQGRHPSIDAVREQLGNTGSKTTIQRYLRELEDEDGGGAGKGISVSEAIQELASRLGARLKEEANELLIEQRQQYEAKLQDKDALIAQLRQENAGLSSQLQRTEVALCDETAQRTAVDEALAEARLTMERLTQQVADLGERLKDNEAHRQSLEEKHQHARDALEHYRQSVKEQREQDQRRHEHQVQQLQMEIRNLGQSLIVKQDELTRIHQELAKVITELAGTRKALRQTETAKDRQEQAGVALSRQVAEQEATQARLAEQIKQLSAASEEALRQLEAARSAAKQHEATCIRLQATVDVQAGLLANLTKQIPDQPAAH
ncbi:DNA-binding protein [Chitinimonas sp.]|uniref:DNA-binding protein n=1 Tax=Chitinimonas sp. TaxID=1934313 RepID=UPI0035ADCB8F